MIINLTDLPAYYINLESEPIKGEDTNNLLVSLGFKKVRRAPGFPSKSHAIGVGMAHQNVLLSRLKDGVVPFCLFEDDIVPKNFKQTISVPDDADAIYLGVSKVGINDKSVTEKVFVDRVDGHEDIFKINNMLAAHAVVYLNYDYVDGLTKEIQVCIDKNIPHDIAMAKYMSQHNVYALDDPMFIQDGKFRHFTNRKISDLDHVEIR